MSTRCQVIGLPCAQTALDDELSGHLRAALSQAALVVGGQRQLAATAGLLAPTAEQVLIGADLSGLDAALAQGRSLVVLASGDPGFFGVLRAVRTRLPAEYELQVEPARSSVQAVFAAADLPWDDAVVLSAHGRAARPVINACRRLPKTAVLTSPEFGPAELLTALDDRPRRVVVAERLGSDEARFSHGRSHPRGPHDRRGHSWLHPWLDPALWSDPNVVALVDEGADVGARGWSAPPRLTPHRWALPDDAFDHRDGQVTKAEVRAQALAWLGPGLGDLVWDVGCGSGSVGVECARLGAAVVAVDRDHAQVTRTRTNAETHRVPVDARVGEAPAVFTDLPDPDAVFVGGGGAGVTDILAVAAQRAHRVVVVALAAVERVGPAWLALRDAGLDVHGAQLAVSRLVALPGDDAAHRLAATNPVTVLRGTRP